MLAIERHRKLLELIQKHGSARTAEVARALGVTEETVRRDFEKIEADGGLFRTHGGAVRLDAARQENSVQERAANRAAEKRAIARAALALIENGQTVFFDPSTTVQTLASMLPDQPLTVLTNSLQIPPLLAEKSAIRVVLLGGSFRGSSLSTTGMVAELAADFFRIDAAFISCRGIDAKQGLSEATEEQARLKRHLIGRAKHFYLLADSSKVGLASSFFFAGTSEVDLWITDAEPPAAFRRLLNPQGVRIQIAKS